VLDTLDGLIEAYLACLLTLVFWRRFWSGRLFKAWIRRLRGVEPSRTPGVGVLSSRVTGHVHQAAVKRTCRHCRGYARSYDEHDDGTIVCAACRAQAGS